MNAYELPFTVLIQIPFAPLWRAGVVSDPSRCLLHPWQPRQGVCTEGRALCESEYDRGRPHKERV
jgi:hypothetical protein